MVLKGVSWVHNDKIRSVLKGVLCLHNTKIRSYGLESSLGTQWKNQVYDLERSQLGIIWKTKNNI